LSESQNREAAKHESLKEVAMQVCTRLEGLLGLVEWIKTDMVRKGGRKHASDMDDLSLSIEKISRKIESLSEEDEILLKDKRMTEEALEEISDYDGGILELLSDIESAVKRFSKKKAVPQRDEIKAVLEKTGQMEKRMTDRASLLRGFIG
jgi:hypothetical protein